MKPAIALFFIGALCLMRAQSLEGPRFMIPNRVPDRFEPAPLETQKITGLLGDRMRVNLEGRLLHLDEKGVMEGFQHRPGKQEWIGEHAGKFLDAAARTWLYTRDDRLKTLMNRVARTLMASQLADGYLGTYTDDQRWTSWDVWTHKYDLIGLLSYYRATGDEQALQSSRNIADLLVHTFGYKPGQRDIILAGQHVGMAATSVLEPMVLLYRYTGTRAYLDFCYYITRAWEQPNGPRIISSLDSTGSVYKTANAKAYEMLSNLLGLAELYRLTGETRFLTPVTLAWEDIVARRLYITGTASSSEHFKDNEVLPGDEDDHVGEGCVTVTWIQLNLALLEISGDSKYGDQMERSVFNQLLAAQNPANGDFCYFTPLNGRKDPTPGISCCVSSEPRGMSMIPQLAWGEIDRDRQRGFAMLQYVPGRVVTKVASIESETDFPASGSVVLTVTPGVRPEFALYLRVPDWTHKFAARIGETTYTGHPGEFLVIRRRWQSGDKVNVDIEMTVELISGGKSYPNSIAIQRGPQVLALESYLNPDLKNLAIATPRSAVLGSLNFRAAGTVREAFTVDGNNGQALVLIPFADAVDYRIWLAKP